MLASAMNTILKDPTLSTGALMTLEKLINSALQYDPATQAKLQKLDKQKVKIEIHEPFLLFYFSVKNQEVLLHTAADHYADKETNISKAEENECDAHIKGKLIDYLQLAKQQHSFANSSIHVSGKSALLTEIQDILSQLDIDWEQALIELLGVVPGHGLAELLRLGSKAVMSSKQKFENNFADFLTEELRAVPSKPELEIYYQQISELQSGVQRLEARLQQYTQKK